MTTLLKVCNGLQPLKGFLQPTLETFTLPNRGKKLLNPYPRKRFPPWFVKQTRVQHEEDLTKENKEFIQTVIRDKYPLPDIGFGSASPLKLETIEPVTEWKPHYQRVGVLARKIGIVPMWMKDGKKVLTTMFQVADNHVIKYIPPEEYKPMITQKKNPLPRNTGCLLVGADSCDPQLFTKEYCGLFNEAGVMPKRLLARFHVSPEGALQPGTPLFATHYKIGQYIDIRGKTIDRGFQGVMKRWGFHGMPASHGVTKTHRRPGNIGSGGKKARVMPGTKLPGHMGNRYRIVKAQRIVRINTRYNVIWVLGQASAGETNSLVQFYDTIVPLKTCKALNSPPHFPTYIPTNEDEVLPEELFVDDLHNFNDPTIMYEVEE
ncbi:39S ribosomal protein L3, mitochondrial [Nasonia vitripennis]|uniref:Large ribosomal subunit protein uL3m n=1 Tax=Nasonia vitripennis TaxID=7425 RepID=A0A7M7IQL7_NASVI|nr:39S ribosomal protein L3, mitochondrial [Nasonia vitripennis]